MKKAAIGLFFLLFASQEVKAQTQIWLPPQIFSFTAWVRGYHFTAPCNFTICQLWIPQDASVAGPQNIAVVKFNAGAPPAFPGTTNAITVLFQTQNNNTIGPIACNIAINTGDIIGVYGARTNNCINSYGPIQPVTTIMGNNVTLYRSGMQACLSGTPIGNIWSEINYDIGRIYMYINCCQPPVLGNITGSTTICPNTSYNYSVPIPFAGTITYNWTVPPGSVITSGQGTNQITMTAGATAGQICVTATDSCGNSAPVCINVTLLSPTVTVTPAQSQICLGSNVNLTAAGATTYSWSPAAGLNVTIGANVIASPIVTTTYIVSGSTGGCAGLDTAIVTVITPPTNTFNATTPVCSNTNSTVTYIGTGTPAATYNWNFGGGTIISGTGQGPYQINWAAPGTYTISLDVTENGCNSGVATQQVVVNAVPTSTFTMDTAICTSANANLVYTGTAAAGATYNWNFGAGTVVSGSGQGPYQINWAAPGNYTVSLQVIENGCISTTTVMPIVIHLMPTSNFTIQGSICFGDSALVTYTGNGSPSATYGWNFGGGTIMNGATGQGPYHISYPAPATYNVSLVVSEYSCISTTTTHPIVINPIPTATFTIVPAAICELQSAQMTYTGNATAAAAYSWNFAGGTPPFLNVMGPNTVTYNTAGNYAVTLTVTENGCNSFPDTNYVLVNPLPIVNFSPNIDHGCDSILVLFSNTSTGGGTYSWNFGDGSGSTSTSPTNLYYNGTYSVHLIATTAAGCVDSLSYTNLINVIPSPIANFNASPDINVYTQLQNATYAFSNTSNFATIYSWNFGDGDTSNLTNPNHQYMDTGMYQVTLIATNQFGCTDIITQGPYIVLPNQNFFAPTAFTPNNDGQNDFYRIFGTGMTGIEMSIFDRWGNKVFESNDLNAPGWDGNFHGKKMNTDVYVFYATISFREGKPIKTKGNLTLLR